MKRFNDWLAVKITETVGTMWCAYAFAALAFVSLPASLSQGTQAIIQWIAQTFLQLVLLSIILVGQAVQGAKVEARDAETHDTVIVTHSEIHAKLDVLIQATPGAELP
jgi:hypothetical protein